MAAEYGGPVRRASDVLAWIAARIAEGVTQASTDGGKLTEAPERVPIEDETEASIDGKFSVEAESGRRAVPVSDGAGEDIMEMTALVRVGYYAGGARGRSTHGRLTSGRALDDAQHLAAVLEDGDFFGEPEGVSEVEYLGVVRTTVADLTEVWTSRFRVQWRTGIATS